jgi:predicted rRNA methylase YqxC with S4 and FtsJ domains
MKLSDILVEQEMARSKAEATRLVKQGSVRVLKDDCVGGYPIDPAQWGKITEPRTEIKPRTPLIVGNGHWRLVSRDGAVGYDQLWGVGRA